MNRFGWISAHTVAEAASSASATVADAMAAAPQGPRVDGAAVVKAGGIDLLDLMKENLLAPRQIVNLRAIPGLDGVTEEQSGGVRIGPLITLTRLAEHPLIGKRYTALAEAAASSASPQIRNAATLGGNLLQRPRCWYFRAEDYRCLRKGGAHCFAMQGENEYHAIFGNEICAIVHPSTAATALVALGAEVGLTNAQGTVRRLPLERFFIPPETRVDRENDLNPHEILTAIVLPALPASARSVHMKQGEKDSFDWPLADVAVVLDRSEDGRCRSVAVVLGAAAPVPHHAQAAEAMLVGKVIDEELAQKAGRAAVESATPLAKNAYKVPIFETLVRRTILKATGRA